jgi:colanic acid/amylovoran biosynthesis glycosyltransferase
VSGPVQIGHARRRLSTGAGVPPFPETVRKVRQPVAVVVSRFPKITETFILREIEALERLGQPVRLVPLLEHRDPVVHPRALPWVEEALYTPFLSGPILRENLAALREGPAYYLRTLLRVVIGSASGLRALAGAVTLFPKAVYLGRRLADEGVGHVHAHFATHPATVAHVASAFSGIPYSFTAHAHDIFLASSRPLLGSKIRAAAFVRTISDYNRRFLEARYPTARDRMHVIHMGLDPTKYRRHSVHPGRVLCVASLRAYKGIETLITACDRAPLRDRTFELLLVGDGPQRARLTRQVRRLGLEDRVRLLGARTEDEVTELLATAELFVHPSCVTRSGWMDGIPVALMEAMATGVPVVSTWVSGIPELVGDRDSGRLVFPSNPDELAEVLAGLLDDPQAARTMGERGRRAVRERFELDGCATQLIQVLERHSLEPPSPAEAIERVVRAHLNPRAQVSLRRLHQRPDSTVAEVSVLDPGGGDPKAWVVKIHRELHAAERTAAERATVEFETLRLLEDGRHGGAAPIPPAPPAVALVAEEGALILGRVPAVPLDERIRAWRRRGTRVLEQRLLPSARAAGLWLRWFQDLTRPAVTGCCEEIVAHVRERALEDLAFAEARLSRSVAERTRAMLESCDPASVGAGRVPVGHHCDFWPGNVLEIDSHISVIDFEGFRPGLAYQDAGRFMVHLDLALARPWLAGSRERVRAAFLAGYGSVEDQDRELWSLCVASEALALLARQANGRRTRRSLLSTWRSRPVVRWLDWALASGAESP